MAIKTKGEAIRLLLGWPWIRLPKRVNQAEFDNLAERVEILENAVNYLRAKAVWKSLVPSAERPKPKKESLQNGSRHYLSGTMAETKQSICDYVNWAKKDLAENKNPHTPYQNQRRGSPMEDWSDDKRRAIYGYATKLELVRVVSRSGRGPVFRSQFCGTQKKLPYTPTKIDKLSKRLFKKGKGKLPSANI